MEISTVVAAARLWKTARLHARGDGYGMVVKASRHPAVTNKAARHAMLFAMPTFRASTAGCALFQNEFSGVVWCSDSTIRPSRNKSCLHAMDRSENRNVHRHKQ